MKQLGNKVLSHAPIEADRDNDIGEVNVDVGKRDQEDGTFDINIIIYKRPDVRKEAVEPAIKVACIHLFNNNQQHIERYYRDESAIARDIGARVNHLDSWVIDIKHPRSLFFSNVHTVKKAFVNYLSKALNK